MEKEKTQARQLKQKARKLLKGKQARLLIIVAAAGVILILLGDLLSGSGAKKTQTVQQFDENAYNEQYVAHLQQELTALISSVAGVGEVRVSVALETGVQYVYATNEKSTGDTAQDTQDSFSQRSTSESTIIVIEGQNGKEPLVLKRIEPTVQGVVVVCQGADNAAVRQAIVEIVSTLCGIGTNRVSVAKMQ